jgi:glycosyltransferase involved in cell wall biosynthesis
MSIVIPAYNEGARLPRTLERLKDLIGRGEIHCKISEVFVVNDGSTDDTSDVVRKYASEWPELNLIELRSNLGKGAAVRMGMLAAKTPWVLTADADMAIPWREINHMQMFADVANMVMASRALPESEIQIPLPWYRKRWEQVFNFLARKILRLKYRDTQCGFKLIKKDTIMIEKILPRLTVDRFAWDLELIMKMERRNLKIFEIPVKWRHQEPSHVDWRQCCEMLWTLFQLGKRYR